MDHDQRNLGSTSTLLVFGQIRAPYGRKVWVLTSFKRESQTIIIIMIYMDSQRLVYNRNIKIDILLSR